MNVVLQISGMPRISDELFQCPHADRLARLRGFDFPEDTIMRLSSLLQNGIEIRVGESFPNGWCSVCGERIYKIATNEMLKSAFRGCILNNPRRMPAVQSFQQGRERPEVYHSESFSSGKC